MDDLVIVRSLVINSANSDVPIRVIIFLFFFRYTSIVCILTMSEWLSQWTPRHCLNNQFLWFSELNPNVKGSINLSGSFMCFIQQQGANELQLISPKHTLTGHIFVLYSPLS